MNEFRLPSDSEHCCVWGHTGSGKTQLGAWLLSKKNLKSKPHFILDYKGDELINSPKNIREIGFELPTKKPGLYILHSRPDLEEETENWLWSIWSAENVHLYVDEGYMVPQGRHGAFDALQTQGRSKRISVTTLSQRPVQISRFAISEASHVAAFHLNDERDIKTAEQIVPRGFFEWLPPEYKKAGGLPKFYARWYNVKDRAKYILRPVPDVDTIVAEIDRQLVPKITWF